MKGAFLERADSGRQTDPLQVKFQWILAELWIIKMTEKKGIGEDIDSKANRKQTNRVRDLWIGSLERTDFGDQNALIKS